MTPLELLKRELNEFERALQKSVDLYKSGKITSELHLTHKINLRAKIDAYTEAIDAVERVTEPRKKYKKIEPGQIVDVYVCPKSKQMYQGEAETIEFIKYLGFDLELWKVKMNGTECERFLIPELIKSVKE